MDDKKEIEIEKIINAMPNIRTELGNDVKYGKAVKRAIAESLVNADYGNVRSYQEQIRELEQQVQELQKINENLEDEVDDLSAELDSRDRCDYQYEYQTDDETINEAKRTLFETIFDKDSCGDLGEYCDEGWVFTVDRVEELRKQLLDE